MTEEAHEDREEAKLNAHASIVRVLNDLPSGDRQKVYDSVGEWLGLRKRRSDGPFVRGQKAITEQLETGGR